jgi:hypothetical protein
VLVFLQRGAIRDPIPTEIDGVRTRIIERNTFPQRGLLTASQSDQLVQSASSVSVPVGAAAVQSAIATKETYAAQLMADPAIQGVGVSASQDSPGDAALIVYVLAGKSHAAIPATMGGFRTRIKETTGFRAGFGRTAIGKGCQATGSQTATSVNTPSARR